MNGKQKLYINKVLAKGNIPFCDVQSVMNHEKRLLAYINNASQFNIGVQYTYQKNEAAGFFIITDRIFQKNLIILPSQRSILFTDKEITDNEKVIGACIIFI